MTTHHVYAPQDRPDVEVLVDGVWRPGEERMVSTEPDGTVTRSVVYRVDGAQFGERVADERVRPDTVDRSFGRSSC